MSTRALNRKQEKVAEQRRHQPGQQEDAAVPVRNPAKPRIPKHFEQRIVTVHRRLICEPHQGAGQRCPDKTVRGDRVPSNQPRQAGHELRPLASRVEAVREFSVHIPDFTMVYRLSFAFWAFYEIQL